MEDEVFETMEPYFSQYYANPSSMHKGGVLAREGIERARNTIAAVIGTEGTDIIFTSGGHEASNLAIQGFAFANQDRGNHIITFAKAAESILGPCNFLENSASLIDGKKFKVTYIDSADKLEGAISDETILIAIPDSVWPIDDILRVKEKSKASLFIEAFDKFCKVSINISKIGADLISFDSLAVGGPPGVGALYIKKGVKIKPIFTGGSHERKIRSGTENVPGIVGFAKAVKLRAQCL